MIKKLGISIPYFEINRTLQKTGTGYSTGLTVPRDWIRDEKFDSKKHTAAILCYKNALVCLIIPAKECEQNEDALKAKLAEMMSKIFEGDALCLSLIGQQKNKH